MANEKRLIDANALLAYIHNHDYELVSRMGCVDKGMFTDGIEHGINIQPTVDAVEVVRCKDCKQWNCVKKLIGYDKLLGYCLNDEEPIERWEHDFCSYGERKDNETD